MQTQHQFRPHREKMMYVGCKVETVNHHTTITHPFDEVIGNTLVVDLRERIRLQWSAK